MRATLATGSAASEVARADTLLAQGGELHARAMGILAKAERLPSRSPLVDTFGNDAGVLVPDGKRLMFRSNRDGINQLSAPCSLAQRA